MSRTDSAALVAAVSRDDIDAARALLDAGTSPDLRHGKYGTPLLGLARSAQMLRLLLRHGADPNARASNGRTPLFFFHDIELLTALLDAGADPDAIDHNGENAAFGLAGFYGGSIAGVRLLVERGADPSRRNLDGQSIGEVALAGATSALELGIAREIVAWLERWPARREAYHSPSNPP
jgi:ankyrin repeat protein